MGFCWIDYNHKPPVVSNSYPAEGLGDEEGGKDLTVPFVCTDLKKNSYGNNSYFKRILLVIKK